MKFLRKYTDDKQILFSILLIVQFIFFITFTRYYLFSINKNSNFIFFPYSMVFLIAIIYALLFVKSSFQFKELKNFYLNYSRLINIIILIIILYNFSFFYTNFTNELNINLINFFLKNFSYASDYIVRNTVIFFLIFFIFNLYLVWKLRLNDINVINILLNFSKFFLFLAFLNVASYLITYDTEYIKIYHIFSDLENCLYFQFLPIGADGKRNYEIIPFLIGYILTLNFKNKKEKILNLLFFLSCFLSFSKNVWIASILVTLIYLIICFDKKKFFRHVILMIIIIVALVNISSTMFNLINESCKIEFKSYTKVKLYSLMPNEVVKEQEKIHLKKLKNFKKVYLDHLSDEEYILESSRLLNSTPERMEIYKNSFNEFTKKPLFGYGVRNYTVSKRISSYDNTITLSSNPESQILKILLDIGIAGLILWLLLIFEIFKSCRNFDLKLCFLGILFLSIFNVYSWFVPTYLLLSLFSHYKHSS